jgi:hypothetical protein
MYSEIQFTCSLGVDNKFIDGSRYMDDCLIFIIFDLNVPSTYTRAMKFIEKYKQCYDSCLQLEEEIITNNTFNFLESTITIVNEKIILSPLRKNWLQICTTNTLLMNKFQHFYSFNPLQSKLGVIISTLHRLQSNSSNPSILTFAIIQIWTELILSKYPSKIIKKTILHVTNKSQLPMWFDINKLISTIEINK